MELSKARYILSYEMHRHSLSQKGWTHGFDNAKKRFGVCKKIRKHISISKYLAHLNSEEEVRDTVLHEIAHALAIERGQDDNHGPRWKSIAREIGCRAERCHSAETVPGRFVYACPACNTQIRYHRRLVKLRACRECCNKNSHGKYDARFQFVPVGSEHR